MMFAARVQLSPNPSLVLAPESALRVRPRRALSSAPVACSVSAMAVWSNSGTKKQLDFRRAFRHGEQQPKGLEDAARLFVAAHLRQVRAYAGRPMRLLRPS